MKLKIKIRDLIILILFTSFLILIVVPVVNLEIATYLNNNGSAKAQTFFNNYMASPIKVNEKRGLYEYGMSLVGGFEKFQINLNGWGGGERTSPENMKKAMELYEDILLKDKENNYRDEYSTKAYLKLLDTSILTLDMDKLAYWIDWGKDLGNEEIKHLSKEYQAYYYFVEKDYKKSKEILDTFEEDRMDGRYYQLMGDLNLHLGNRKEAGENYEALVAYDLSPKEHYQRKYFGGNELSIYREGVEDYLKKSEGKYKIRGKVSYQGKGLPLVEVYINEDIGTFSTGGKFADAVTDKNGEFETLPLKQGVYDIGIGIHPSQLYDRVFLEKDINSIEVNSDMEVDFEFVKPMEIKTPEEKILVKEDKTSISWDKVEGAAYYKLESLVFTDPKERGGALLNIPIKDLDGNEKIKDNRMDFNMKGLDKRTRGFYFEGEEEVVNPTAIFGPFIPGVEYPLTVKAYDKKGNHIGGSLTLISDYEDLKTIEVGGELTQGEKLILDKKYREAIAYYENILVEKPKDKEALFYLVRFYSAGWKKGEKDILKAAEYAQVYDREYKDYNLSLEVIDELYGNETKENKGIVKELLERIPEEKRDSRYNYIKAVYLVEEKDYIGARKSYEKINEERPVEIVYIDMYLADYERAIDTLNNEEIDLMRINKKILVEALESMEDLSKEDKELFKNLLKVRLDTAKSIDEEIKTYNETLKKVESPELKEVIKQIAKEEQWDERY